MKMIIKKGEISSCKDVVKKKYPNNKKVEMVVKVP